MVLEVPEGTMPYVTVQPQNVITSIAAAFHDRSMRVRESEDALRSIAPLIDANVDNMDEAEVWLHRISLRRRIALDEKTLSEVRQVDITWWEGCYNVVGPKGTYWLVDPKEVITEIRRQLG